MVYRYLSKFVTFQRYDYFVNPARADPTLFSTFSPDNYLYTMRLHESKKICLCLSPVFIVKSRLLEPHSRSLSSTSSGNRMLLKSLDCIFHSYEWERSSSFWCMVFGVDTMHAQLNGAAISIETKPSNPSSKFICRHKCIWSDIATLFSNCRFWILCTRPFQCSSKSQKKKSKTV